MKQLIKIFITIFLLFNTLWAQNKLDKVTLQLDWLHQFQFAGYYIAKEKGFFKENGLDVTIKEFDYGINQVEEVLNNKTTFAVGKSSLIIDKLEGKNILALASIFQESPMILLTRKDSNIRFPKDLINKKVMLTKDARTAVAINSMIVSQGVSLDQIDFIPHSFKLEDLIEGRTDAMGCYLSNEPFILKNKNIDINIINPKDYGFDFYGGMLFTSQKEFKENPNRVHNFYSAVIKGWSYAFENMEEATDIILKKYNTQNKTREALLYEAKVLKQLAHYDEGQLGKIELKKIKEIMKIYLILGLTPLNNINIEELIFNQDDILITKSEKEYLKNNTIKYQTIIKEPFNFFQKNRLTGIEIDYWNLIRRIANLRTEVNSSVNNDVKTALKKLKKKEIDIKIVNSYKDYQQDFIRLSKPLEEYQIAIATLNDKNYIPNTAFLENKRVAICKECVILKKIQKDYPNVKFVKVNNIEQGLELLSNDKVFAVIESIPVLINKISSNGFTNIKISGTTEYTYKIQYAVHKDNLTLLSIVNKAIDKITKKQRESINNQYINVKYDSVQDYSWVFKIALPLLIVMLFMLVSNFRLKKEIKRRVLAENNLHLIANTDELTQIYNRRKIDELYENNFSLAKRYNRPLSVIFFDIDNFKNLNDAFGHKKGDEVLIEITHLIKQNIRSTDVFGRWGGEEFILILPETTSDNAVKTAENLKAVIEHHNFPVGIQVTSSFGVSSLQPNDSSDDILTRADHAMYYVKERGKNGVKLA